MTKINNKKIISAWKIMISAAAMLGQFGCAGIQEQPADSSASCEILWQTMDDAIARYDMGDGFAVSVDNFDYLRADRFIVALGQQVSSDKEERTLVEQMRQMDLQKRYRELDLLPDRAWAGFAEQGYSADQGVFKRQVAACSVEKMKQDSNDPDYFSKVMASINTNQDYSTLYRILGLYPLVRPIIASRVKVFMEDNPVQIGYEHQPDNIIVEPVPATHLTPQRIQRVLRNSRVKPFLRFQLTERDLLGLVHYYAPVFHLDKSSSSFGQVVPSGIGGWRVDEQNPTVYYYLSQAIIQGIPALQINYVIWLNNRAGPAPWFTQGHLDGINVRVTLDWQGRPLVSDIIGNCGCFYIALTNDDLIAEERQEQDGYIPDIVGSMPTVDMSSHLSVRLEAGSNMVTGVSSVPLSAVSLQYNLTAYDDLEDLSDELSGRFFDEEGFVSDTERFERYFLFPAGIANVGAMRQRGRQPISLIETAYFDDPHMFDFLIWKESLPVRTMLVKKGKGGKSGLMSQVEAGKSMKKPGRDLDRKYSPPEQSSNWKPW